MSELNISVLIIPKTILISGEIYTADKNFTMPLAVTAGTNLTSDSQSAELVFEGQEKNTLNTQIPTRSLILVLFSL